MATVEYGVHPAIRMAVRMVGGLADKTGRTLEEWVALIRAEGPDGERERAAWLKSEHGLGTNYAGMLVEAAEGKGAERRDPEAYLQAAGGWVDSQYEGKRSALRPVCDRLVEVGAALGDDVRICPTKTFVALYRKHVFAQIKATTQTRVDLGLALGDAAAEERLIDTGGAAKGDRITHRIPLAARREIDEFVLLWLRDAYDRDG